MACKFGVRRAILLIKSAGANTMQTTKLDGGRSTLAIIMLITNNGDATTRANGERICIKTGSGEKREKLKVIARARSLHGLRSKRSFVIGAGTIAEEASTSTTISLCHLAGNTRLRTSLFLVRSATGERVRRIPTSSRTRWGVYFRRPASALS